MLSSRTTRTPQTSFIGLTDEDLRRPKTSRVVTSRAGAHEGFSESTSPEATATQTIILLKRQFGAPAPGSSPRQSPGHSDTPSDSNEPPVSRQELLFEMRDLDDTLFSAVPRTLKKGLSKVKFPKRYQTQSNQLSRRKSFMTAQSGEHGHINLHKPLALHWDPLARSRKKSVQGVSSQYTCVFSKPSESVRWLSVEEKKNPRKKVEKKIMNRKKKCIAPSKHNQKAARLETAVKKRVEKVRPQGEKLLVAAALGLPKDAAKAIEAAAAETNPREKIQKIQAVRQGMQMRRSQGQKKQRLENSLKKVQVRLSKCFQQKEPETADQTKRAIIENKKKLEAAKRVKPITKGPTKQKAIEQFVQSKINKAKQHEKVDPEFVPACASSIPKHVKEASSSPNRTSSTSPLRPPMHI